MFGVTHTFGILDLHLYIEESATYSSNHRFSERKESLNNYFTFSFLFEITECHLNLNEADGEQISMSCPSGSLENNAVIMDIDGRRGFYSSGLGYLSLSTNFVKTLNEISIAFWVKLMPKESTSLDCILYIETKTVQGENVKVRVYHKNGALHLTMHNTTSVYRIEAHLSEFRLGVWMHVGVVCEVDEGVSFYLNGCVVREDYIAESSSAFSVYYTAFWLGRRPYDVGKSNKVTHMYADDVYIWRRKVPEDYFYLLYINGTI